jgi:L-glyceraldehyde 3-phosphate reductase
MHPHTASPARYDNADFYRRAGSSGLFLPRLSLGLWHNFGAVDAFGTQRAIVLRAFDRGITHFDLANNYGPPPGAAEENFGRILASDLKSYRDELIVSTKAGHRMWPGPYGEWGSKKYLLSSLDQSLRRMGLDSVDIFYSHRFDPGTPLEETMEALACAVRSGKALYVGLSSYPPAETQRACAILRAMGVRPLLHQPAYNMLDRHLENGLLDAIAAEGMGCIVFCPLAQGLLTNRYLQDIPDDSRAAKPHGFLKSERVTDSHRGLLKSLHSIAAARGQSVAQLALAWVLRDERVTSALIGVSSLAQLEDNLDTMKNTAVSTDEREAIEAALANR